MLRPKRSRWLCLALFLALLAAACAPSPDAGDGTGILEEDPKLEEGQDVEEESATSDGDESSAAVIEEGGGEVDEALIVESSGASDGDLVLLNAEEIEQLLSGNTITGNWVGEDYEQFFSSDGSTIYRPLGGQDSVGEWRVNAESGLYESLWPGVPTWDDYEVHQEDDTFFWTGQGVQLSPFTVVDGDQLTGA